MSRGWRARRYGASVGVVLVGVACGIVLNGTLAGTLATLLIGIGLVGVVSLIFYEVGLSEDRDRADHDRADHDREPRDREDRGREDRDRAGSSETAPPHPGTAPGRSGRRHRLDRRRGERRRLP